jgi:hypothetical protein
MDGSAPFVTKLAPPGGLVPLTVVGGVVCVGGVVAVGDVVVAGVVANAVEGVPTDEKGADVVNAVVVAGGGAVVVSVAAVALTDVVRDAPVDVDVDVNVEDTVVTAKLVDSGTVVSEGLVVVATDGVVVATKQFDAAKSTFPTSSAIPVPT